MGRIDNDASPTFQTKLLSSVTFAGAAVLVEEKLGSPATYREKNSILRTSRRHDKALVGVKPSRQIQLGRAPDRYECCQSLGVR